MDEWLDALPRLLARVAPEEVVDVLASHLSKDGLEFSETLGASLHLAPPGFVVNIVQFFLLLPPAILYPEIEFADEVNGSDDDYAGDGLHQGSLLSEIIGNSAD